VTSIGELDRLDAYAPVAEWRINGRATIDYRPAASCILTVRSNGTWSADLALFTLAGAAELFFVADDGGHFCGPASVARSRADSDPFAMHTRLDGAGPLLVVDPSSVLPEIEDDPMLDGEVVDEVSQS
jgi:hypothetical protein